MEAVKVAVQTPKRRKNTENLNGDWHALRVPDSERVVVISYRLGSATASPFRSILVLGRWRRNVWETWVFASTLFPQYL